MRQMNSITDWTPKCFGREDQVIDGDVASQILGYLIFTPASKIKRRTGRDSRMTREKLSRKSNSSGHVANSATGFILSITHW
jgi:hypothetical protein